MDRQDRFKTNPLRTASIIFREKKDRQNERQTDRFVSNCYYYLRERIKKERKNEGKNERQTRHIQMETNPLRNATIISIFKKDRKK